MRIGTGRIGGSGATGGYEKSGLGIRDEQLAAHREADGGGRQIAAFYSDMPTDHGASGSPVLNAKGEVIGVVEAVVTDTTGGFIECQIISANVVWEALQIANKSIHPRGFKTGVTIGLNFFQDGLEPSRDVENPANSNSLK